MASLGNFNANEHESSAFEPLPNGDYLAMVTDSEIKATKDGKGQFLKMTIEILDGNFKNRKVFANFNLVNRSDEAVKIAKSQLADLCRAVGVLFPKDSAELHRKPFIAGITVRPAKDGYDASNDVKTYKPAKAISTPAIAEAAAELEPAPLPWKV